MKVTLSAKDAGLEREIDTLLSLNRVEITEGIHEDAGSVDGISIAEYAAMNDLGTRHIPARPWLRSYWETQSERVMKAFERLSNANDLPTALEKLALWVETDHRNYVKRTHWPRNTLKTIERKGSDKPLIDEGFLINAILCRIKGG